MEDYCLCTSTLGNRSPSTTTVLLLLQPFTTRVDITLCVIQLMEAEVSGLPRKRLQIFERELWSRD